MGMPVKKSLLECIGGTPLVEATKLCPDSAVRVFLKLEGFNASGSVKDRPALYMVRDAIRSGRLRPGMTILEATSGNLGIALSMIGSREGYPVTLVAPRSITEERKKLISFYGTEIIYTDGPTTRDSITRALILAEENPAYCFLYQYANPANALAHYETTGRELIEQLPEVDVVVSGLGSAGTLMGTGRRVKEHNPQARLIAVEPYPGSRLQGLRNIEEDGYSPPILDLDLLDGRLLVSGEHAHLMVREAARKEGIFLGMSAGAVLYGALHVARSMQSGNVVAILADAGWKYMSIGICEESLPGDIGNEALIKAW
ncbi:MAG TPA: PLP-dependent cysteine synthase family protein [Ktedonobacteraceae bacterium]|jgi:cysteine synthase B